MDFVKQHLQGLVYGPVTHSGHLAVVPLLDREGTASPPFYDTLKDAVGAGVARVTEISEGGSVPELLVVNDGPRPVLLVDGEELVGARQNRIVNITLLVPAHGKLHIPVSCVEAGRWSYRAANSRPLTARSTRRADATRWPRSTCRCEPMRPGARTRERCGRRSRARAHECTPHRRHGPQPRCSSAGTPISSDTWRS